MLRETKNGTDRIVDLPPRAVAALASLSARLGRVFLAPHGNPAFGRVQMVPYQLSGDNKFGSGGGQIKRSWATALKGAEVWRGCARWRQEDDQPVRTLRQTGA